MFLIPLLAMFFAEVSTGMTDSSKKDNDCKTALTETAEPKFFDLFDSTNSNTERFTRLMNQGLSSRYLHQAEVQVLIQRLHSAEPGNSRLQINVEWAMGRARLAKKKEFGRVIYIIESLAVFEEGEALTHGQKPHRPSQLFPRILSAITEAMRLDVLADPSLRRAEIIMGVVVNEGLLTLLKDLGFQELPANYAASSGLLAMNPFQATMTNIPARGMPMQVPMDTGSGFSRNVVPKYQSAPSFIMGFVNRSIGRGRP